jgi:hypothetical protein
MEGLVIALLFKTLTYAVSFKVFFSTDGIQSWYVLKSVIPAQYVVITGKAWSQAIDWE